MQQMVIYWYSIVNRNISDIFMPIIRRSDCFPLLVVVCPVVVVVMLESRVARCVHYYRQWNAVGSPGDGHKDARNISRYY